MLVFLANTVKDYGAVHAAIDLYERALKMEEKVKSIKQLYDPSINTK